jgi:hypothetical protein
MGIPWEKLSVCDIHSSPSEIDHQFDVRQHAYGVRQITFSATLEFTGLTSDEAKRLRAMTEMAFRER